MLIKEILSQIVLSLFPGSPEGGCPEPLNRHMVVATDSLLHEDTAFMSVPMSYHGSGLVIKAVSYCLPSSFHPPGHDTARRPLLNTMLVLRLLDL